MGVLYLRETWVQIATIARPNPNGGLQKCIEIDHHGCVGPSSLSRYRPIDHRPCAYTPVVTPAGMRLFPLVVVIVDDDVLPWHWARASSRRRRRRHWHPRRTGWHARLSPPRRRHCRRTG